jgi:hypothetical protein
MATASRKTGVYVLAEPSSNRSIRSVHFDDGETRIQKLAGQTGPIGACTFNRVDGVGAKLLGPDDQIVVSLASGGDTVLSELAAIGGQCDGHVNVFVGVDADHDVRFSALADLCQG